MYIFGKLGAALSPSRTTHPIERKYGQSAKKSKKGLIAIPDQALPRVVFLPLYNRSKDKFPMKSAVMAGVRPELSHGSAVVVHFWPQKCDKVFATFSRYHLSFAAATRPMLSVGLYQCRGPPGQGYPLRERRLGRTSPWGASRLPRGMFLRLVARHDFFRPVSSLSPSGP